MDKRKIYLLVVIILLIFSTGCTNSPRTEAIAEDVIEHLINDDYENVYNHYFSNQLKESMSFSVFSQMWEEKSKASGTFIERQSLTISERENNFTVAEADLEYTDFIFQVRMIFNEMDELISIHFSNGVVNAILPEGVKEEEVLIGEGTPYELGGTLTLPTEVNTKVPAVVLVHGSGPSDRDESAFAYKPFRDIAWGLAEHGIAVLRYDKRTFIYGNEFSAEQLKRFTVHEETVEDAILAGNLLKDDSRIDANRVFLVGHSLGGMLAPRIETQGGNFAGLVILAGSPRPLWEIIYDQNIDFSAAEGMDESVIEEQLELIKQEYEKAKQMAAMTDEEAQSQAVFGVPAFYFKEMDQYPPKELVAQITKPILILQGEDDFQVSFEKDFKMWKEILDGHENASFISYPKLNHFFIEYEGTDEGTISEYDYPKLVEQYVIDDISQWIFNNW